MAQRLSLLERWEIDAKLLQIAADEGMAGGEQPQLGLVRNEIKALHEHPRDARELAAHS